MAAERRRLGRGAGIRGSLLAELGSFGVVGACCLAVDLLLFQVLYAYQGVDAVGAKAVSTLVSMTLAFLGHRFWSFAARARTGLRREYLAFLTVNGATLLLGLAIVAVVRHPLGQTDALVLQAANVVSIAAGTVVRFLTYRRWVFPAPVTVLPVPPLAPLAHAAPSPEAGVTTGSSRD